MKNPHLVLIAVPALVAMACAVGACSDSTTGGGSSSGASSGSSGSSSGSSGASSGSSGTSSGSSGTSSGSSGASSGSSGASCTSPTGMFACGSSKSCSKANDFCVIGGALGAQCKSIGGDGSTCPSCSNIVGLAGQCSGGTPTCSGDETTGITVTCK